MGLQRTKNTSPAIQDETSTDVEVLDIPTNNEALNKIFKNPVNYLQQEGLTLFEFIECFWNEVSEDKFKPNWHISYLCEELEKIAERVGENKPREYDLIINQPPGTTKTIVVSIMFPIWCWTKWFHLKFICCSYSGLLALESAEKSRDIIRSDKFKALYPHIGIKEDKDTKSNFRIYKQEKREYGNGTRLHYGGTRFSTSVGGTLMGYHGHILIVDDPINPTQAASPIELENANNWVEQTLPTRKTDKDVVPTILVMQRLHMSDPAGHMLAKKKANVKHICLPGEIRNYGAELNPPELKKHYVDDLMDPVRMSWTVLKDLEADLGQYGYAGQIGQRPTPPGGGMFKVDNFMLVETPPEPQEIAKIMRYWDKAGTAGKGAFTVGVKMARLKNNKMVVLDVKRGQWSSEVREGIIRSVAEADGKHIQVGIEQEPGSGGKESMESTVRNLIGFSVHVDKPTGDKEFRADPYSVQVNNRNILLLKGEWNYEFIEEHRFFPFGTYKDQIDAVSAAFNVLAAKRQARAIGRRN